MKSSYYYFDMGDPGYPVLRLDPNTRRAYYFSVYGYIVDGGQHWKNIPDSWKPAPFDSDEAVFAYFRMIYPQ